jgi:hypothetical protein
MTANEPGLPFWPLGLAIVFALTLEFAINMFSIISVLAVYTESTWGYGPVPNSLIFLSLAGFTLVGVLTSGQLLKAGVPPYTMLVISATMLFAHFMIIVIWNGCVDELWSFLLWTAICGVSYATLNSSNTASVAGIVPTVRVGFCIGTLGLVDSVGSALAPLYMSLFGVGDAMRNVPIREGL